MFRRPMTRLAIAAAAAGTICALGASAASAAPSATWSGGRTVPGAITNDSPTASSITFPVAHGQGQIVGWRARGAAGRILYKYKVPGLNKGHWSATGRVPGTTSSAPAFGSYRDPLGHWAVLAVWTGPADHHIWFAQGETRADGTISWTKETQLPRNVADTNTTNGPSVLFPNHSYRVVISWRGPANHVRFTVGTPLHRGFKFFGSKAVPGPTVTPTCKNLSSGPAPCTGNTPALAEVNANATSGTIYFFWRQLSTRAVQYATTPDTAGNLASPVFSAPATVPGAATAAGPAASDTGIDGFGPLLLAYKAPFSTAVHFQTLPNVPSAVWSPVAAVPHTHTAVAPALLFNELATTTPATDGNIVLHHFTP
jgi:hypothetical protein